MTHFSSRFTDGNAVFADGEIIFIFYFDAPFHIQVNKGLDVILTAVNVIGHRIMGIIQEPLADMKIRKKAFIRNQVSRKPRESCFEAGFNRGKTGRSLSELAGDKHI